VEAAGDDEKEKERRNRGRNGRIGEEVQRARKES
jgi:hypothetical protein